MKAVIYCIFASFIAMSCSSDVNEGFNSIVLTASKGGRVYINSVNRGLTGDKQLTVISSDKDRLRYDAPDAIDGLMPFIYTFHNDTLHLYHTAAIHLPENLNGIHIAGSQVNNSTYAGLEGQAIAGGACHCVPDVVRKAAAPAMPQPGK